MRLYIKKQNAALQITTLGNPEKVAVMYKIGFNDGERGAALVIGADTGQ